MAQPDYLLDKLGRRRRRTDVDGAVLRYRWIQGTRVCGQQNTGRAGCCADDCLKFVSRWRTRRDRAYGIDWYETANSTLFYYGEVVSGV